MILQALNDYYVRRGSDTEGGLAPEGFEYKAIPYVLVLDGEGRLVQLDKHWEGEGKKRVAKSELVPQGVKKTSGVAANLLWDTAEYVLGVDTKGNPKRVAEQQAAFLARLREIFGEEPDDVGLRAVYRFLAEHRTDALDVLATDPAWPEVLETNPLVTFQLNTDLELVCQRAPVCALVAARVAGEPDGLCLVSGEADVIERLHAPIKGIWGAQTSGANIVSFNLDAFSSYGKSQSFNAPVGRRAAFGYTTALNHLLAKGSRQRVQVGDASTVFWAEKDSGGQFEGFFLDFVDSWDDPDRGSAGVAALYNSVKSGQPFSADDDQRFFVLGLSPNAARIAVRFWHVEPIAVLSARFDRYFRELEIVRHPDARPYFTLNQLLNSMALNGERSRLPQKLGGEILDSVIRGCRYPALMLNLALGRCRAEQSVTHPRAAILKAWVNRYFEREELKVELDEDDGRPPYLLGRLFAVLERLQEEANPGTRSTIRNTYWSAASGAPLRVFPMLIDLGTRHLQKLKRERPGRATNIEKLIGAIVSKLDRETPFPNSFSATEQAVFIVGFYQQKQHPSTYRAQGDQE